jgi:hypothetical protein
MAYLITHFYDGGNAGQYQAAIAAVHPPAGLPAGQVYHAAGPCDGGWLIASVWDSKASCDRFVTEILLPTLPTVEGGFAGPPHERAAEVAYLITA